MNIIDQDSKREFNRFSIRVIPNQQVHTIIQLFQNNTLHIIKSPRSDRLTDLPLEDNIYIVAGFKDVMENISTNNIIEYYISLDNINK